MLMILYYQMEEAFAEASVVVTSALAVFLVPAAVFAAAHPDPIEEVLALAVFVVDHLVPVVVRDFVEAVWVLVVLHPDLWVLVAVDHDHFLVEHFPCYCYAPDHVCDDHFFPDSSN
jgi:hypothetical protein